MQLFESWEHVKRLRDPDQLGHVCHQKDHLANMHSLPRRSSDGVNMEPGDFLVDMTWMVLFRSVK